MRFSERFQGGVREFSEKQQGLCGYGVVAYACIFLETTETQGQQRKMIAYFVVVSLVSVVSSISVVSASP